jgi:hypothetical protein
VVVAEDGTAVVARQPAVAHPWAAALDLPHPVAAGARPRQMSRAHPHDAEDAPLPATALGLDRAHGAPRPPTADEERQDETGRSPPAPTAGGCPGINHAQRPPTRKQAHQHPGCQGRDPAHHHAAAVALDRALHGL